MVAPGALYVGGPAVVVGLVLAGVHVAAERRKSRIARLSKPAKLASIFPAVEIVIPIVASGSRMSRTTTCFATEAKREGRRVDRGSAAPRAHREELRSAQADP